MKKYILLVITLSILLNLLGCLYKNYEGNLPIDQPGRKWVSEDGSIVLYTNENQKTTGSMVVNGDEIPFVFSNGNGVSIGIYSIEVQNQSVRDVKDRYELWVGDFNRKDKFTVTVKETTYFEVGQKITFYRVDDDEDSSK